MISSGVVTSPSDAESQPRVPRLSITAWYCEQACGQECQCKTNCFILVAGRAEEEGGGQRISCSATGSFGAFVTLESSRPASKCICRVNACRKPVRRFRRDLRASCFILSYLQQRQRPSSAGNSETEGPKDKAVPRQGQWDSTLSLTAEEVRQQHPAAVSSDKCSNENNFLAHGIVLLQYLMWPLGKKNWHAAILAVGYPVLIKHPYLNPSQGLSVLYFLFANADQSHAEDAGGVREAGGLHPDLSHR